MEMLTHIEANPDISQVTLADELGVAEGMINKICTIAVNITGKYVTLNQQALQVSLSLN